jgi:hypothetical protein
MRIQTVVMFALLAAAGAACSESSQVASNPASPSSSGGTDAKRPRSDIAVTTIIENVDANGLPADLSNDGGGAYVHNVGGVRSVLTPNGYNNIPYGDWQFEASTGRLVGTSLDQDDAIQPGDPAYLVQATPPFWGTQVLPAKLQVECTLVNRSMLTMTPGTTFNCGLLDHHIMFNGGQYGRPMSPTFTGYPETTDVQITCNTADTGGCSDWVIEPIDQGRAIARLNKVETIHNQEKKIHIGSFYVRFRIHITRP